MSNSPSNIRHIVETDQCAGCGACTSVCPQQCAAMQIHESGFYRPAVTESQCTGCGLCVSVCPIAQKSDGNCMEGSSLAATRNECRHVYASWHCSDDVRNLSSSGGIFSAIAEHVIEQGGVVFGAAFDDDFVVRHRAVDSIAELDVLRRSKYVQSQIDEKTYHRVLDCLKNKQTVFFVGTPCQIAGLKNVVRAQRSAAGRSETAPCSHELFEHLLTADLICHGVPSPRFFSMYLAELEKAYRSKIASVNFRAKDSDRKQEWGMYIIIIMENGREYLGTGTEDFYYYSFLENLYLQPCCYSCPYTTTSRIGDVTLGDFWGIGKEVPFSHPVEKGISLVMLNSTQGVVWFDGIKANDLAGRSNAAPLLQYEERTLAEAVQGPTKLSRPAKPHPRHEEFKKDFVEKMDYPRLKRKYFTWRQYWKNRLKNRLKRYLKKLIGKRVVSWLRKVKKTLRKS